ncbi:uncharacterized protein LOC113283269 isoform X3 [Papaver somniferum]|uniref:uncharacterized protein LOC113283269 isoform X3 n=1 Tax=Papaver somniferum TaxID=3469 RepID=UPI000E6FDACD|nr:uncharacterized protein LOC113283269 isoform X3 [Papaver somniferum]
MEKSEPALAPEWLKGTGNISGGGNTSHHPGSSLSHSDDHASILSSRNRSSFSIGDYDSPRHSERNLSSHFRRSISSNGSSLHGKDSSSFPRSYSSFKSPRDKDYDKDFLDFHDRERSSLADHRIRDYSDPMGKRGEVWPKKVTAVLNNSKTNSHIISNGVNVGGTTVLNNIHKTTFDRDFPSLGAEERQGVPEIGRVSSPGLGSAAQSLAMGTSAVLTDCWTSALVEPPPTVGSNNIVLSSAQQSSTVNLSIQAPTSLSTPRNMAETVAQAPPRARAAPQLSVETQRLEELAIKQSRQLIPVTPSMPKALVLNSEKQKPKATGRIELTMANKIGQQQQLASNHHVHAPLQAGPTRPDAAKTSFLVLKPTREKNGISPTTKEGSSPTNANRVVANNPLVAAPPSAPSAPNNPKLASSAQRKASPQWSHLDKRITSQARSRNDFFNLIKKQTTANSSSTTPNPDPIVSSSPQKSEELLITESGAAVASPQGGNHAIHLPDANGLKWAATENGGDDTRINGNVCREETNQGYADNGGVEKPSSLDAFVYADDKEVAFLRSLGWDENAVEEGLTAEEINSFYETVQCKELTPSLKLSRLQLVLGPQERSASFGSSSCDSE